MAQITEKELTALSDLLTVEATMKAKCEYMASMTEDATLSDTYVQMAQRHQRHFDELFSNLK
jgi:hypothetical protein